MPPKVPVFISYAREDSTAARKLYDELQRIGADPWLDEVSLLPGERWKVAIKKAIRASSYFIALLSTKAVTKRGVVQSELRQALEILDEFPDSGIFVIPVRIEECSPSDDRLKDLNWVDLFPAFDKGVDKIRRLLFPDQTGQASLAKDVLSPDFYVYVSDAKIVMLSSQIPATVVSQLAADLRLEQNALRQSSTDPMTPMARYALVKIVSSYLRDHQQVGTLDSPSTYFEGELTMKWGPYRTLSGAWDEPSPLVYFGGKTENTIVGLGGSARHVIGSVGASGAHSHSATPYLVAKLYEGLELPLPKEDESALQHQETFRRRLPNSNREHIAMAVDLATTQMIGTEQRLRFLARRLAFFERNKHDAWSENMNILLGTPLYVCLTDD